jgi:two-component system, OmpR family, sensor histidine kinase CreC
MRISFMRLATERTKWRPTLGMIVFAVLAIVMMLPLMGLFIFRLYDNQLIRQTEAELIAQSAVLSAVFAEDVEARLPDGIKLGFTIVQNTGATKAGDFSPIEPRLDLAGNDLQARRPDALPAAVPPEAAYEEIGAKILRLVRETQRTTLAGFRILDPAGVVIAGREENGLSLAHIPEVNDALHGRYRGTLRIRVSNEPPPPVYSLSRGTGVRVFTAMPVIVRGQVAGVIYASRTPSNILKYLYEERGKFLLASAAVLMAVIVIGFVFSRTITHPMHELLHRISEIRRGDRDAFRPLKHHGTREFALLSQSFLGTAKQLANRSDYISMFAAHLTHELKSPLTSIKGAAELLQDSSEADSHSLTKDQQRKFLANILDDTKRLEAIAHRLRELARAEEPQPQSTAEIEPAITRLRQSFDGMTIRSKGTEGLSARISHDNLFIIFSHLTDNGQRHGAHCMCFEAQLKGDLLSIIVSNDGEAISDTNRDKIFDAFFTTRRESGGTGMGLAIVQSMLRAHGGSIRLLPASPKTSLEIQIPAT